MKIEMVSTSELVPYENNPRKVRVVDNQSAVTVVADSIKRFGFRQPLVVDANNVVVVGHTRLMAAKDLGIEKVPVLRAVDLNEEQIKSYRIADNKTAEWTGWEFDKLLGEVGDLESIVPGFTDREFSILSSFKNISEKEKTKDSAKRELGNVQEDDEPGSAADLGLVAANLDYVQVSVFVKKEHEKEALERCEEACKDLR